VSFPAQRPNAQIDVTIRLSEANIESILGEVEEVYRGYSRHGELEHLE
jgi:hypothetical protein